MLNQKEVEALEWPRVLAPTLSILTKAVKKRDCAGITLLRRFTFVYLIFRHFVYTQDNPAPEPI